MRLVLAGDVPRYESMDGLPQWSDPFSILVHDNRPASGKLDRRIWKRFVTAEPTTGGRPMRASLFREQQTAFILQQVDDKLSVEMVCRKADIFQQIFYRCCRPKLPQRPTMPVAPPACPSGPPHA